MGMGIRRAFVSARLPVPRSSGVFSVLFVLIPGPSRFGISRAMVDLVARVSYRCHDLHPSGVHSIPFTVVLINICRLPLWTLANVV